MIPETIDPARHELIIIVQRHPDGWQRGYGLGVPGRVHALAEWFDAAPEPSAADWLLREVFRGMAEEAVRRIDQGAQGWPGAPEAVQ